MELPTHGVHPRDMGQRCVVSRKCVWMVRRMNQTCWGVLYALFILQGGSNTTHEYGEINHGGQSLQNGGQKGANIRVARHGKVCPSQEPRQWDVAFCHPKRSCPCTSSPTRCHVHEDDAPRAAVVTGRREPR